jgi:hypothetical protein
MKNPNQKGREMKNLIRLSKINETPGFPLRAATLYKWRTLRKHPKLFVQLGGAVFVDMAVLDQIIEAGRGAK